MKKARRVFWILFFISSAMVIALILFKGEPQTGAPGPNVPSAESSWIVWIPLITALVSLTGALTTSMMTLRRDRLESQKMQLEVTKLQLEIDQLRKNTGIGSLGNDRESDRLEP